MEDHLARALIQKLDGIRVELHIANRLEMARQGAEAYHRNVESGAYEYEGDDPAELAELVAQMKAERDDMTHCTGLIARWADTIKLPRRPGPEQE